MRKTIVLVIAALLNCAIPMNALAFRPYPGPYVSGFIGVSAPTDTTINGTDLRGTPTSFSERASFDPSINIGATGGYDFGYLRMEGELSYKHGEISDIVDVPTGNRFAGLDGRVGALAMLFNAFVDMHNYSPFTPYVGGGIGFAALHISDTFGTFPNGSFDQVYFSDDDAVFAYQVGGGIGVELNRRLTLDLGYRYFATTRAEFNGSSIPVSFRLESHNGALGIRVKF